MRRLFHQPGAGARAIVLEPIGQGRGWSSRSRASTSSRQAEVARQLHEEARVALIVSLLSLCFPVALPAGLFLGWRVRTHARRKLPVLVEWVSLPFYLASAGLWIGAAGCVFGLFVLAIWLRS
jgi:hypothetical protein